MARRRMAEGGEAKRSCPPPTEAEQAQERRADEARGAAATRAQRSPKKPKPRRLERKAAAGARSSRSRADWSGKLPPEPEEAEAAPTGAESCRRSPSLPPAAQAAAFVHCFTWNIYFALFHVKHFALFHVKHFRILLQIVSRGTLYFVK